MPELICHKLSSMVIVASEMPPYMDSDEADHESFVEIVTCAKPRGVLTKKASLGSEKQISVDPISLRSPSNSQLVRHTHHPITPSPKKVDVLIPLPPPRNKFLSQSLPNSTSSSPSFGSHTSNRKCKNQISQLPSSSLSVMYRQDSVALANLERLREIHLRKSKSCGEGRASAPPEDFDLWFTKVDDDVKHKNSQDNSNIGNDNLYNKIEASSSKPREENVDRSDENFKCKALCLYLPAFSKAKAVKARRQVSDMSSQLEELASAEAAGHVVSKRVSLEKFDCGSWNSMNTEDEGEGDASNRFFDLPLELIRCNASDDTNSPVTTAFVFAKEPKGVLKQTASNSKSTPRKSCESVRHVRFSTTSISNPASPNSCITPRLRKARDDFNAFLEAQSVSH